MKIKIIIINKKKKISNNNNNNIFGSLFQKVKFHEVVKEWKLLLKNVSH